MLGHFVAGAILPAMVLGLTAATPDTHQSQTKTRAEHSVQEITFPPCDNWQWSEPQMEFVKYPNRFDGRRFMGVLHYAFMIDGCRRWGYNLAGSGLQSLHMRNACKENGPIPDSGYGRHRFTYRYNHGKEKATRGNLFAVERIDCRHLVPDSWRYGIFVHSSGDNGPNWGKYEYDNYRTWGCIKVRQGTLWMLRYMRQRDTRYDGTIKVRHG